MIHPTGVLTFACSFVRDPAVNWSRLKAGCWLLFWLLRFPTSDSCGLLCGLLQAKVGGYRTSIFQVCSWMFVIRFNESVQNGLWALKIMALWILLNQHIDLKQDSFLQSRRKKFTHETCGDLWQRFLQIWAIGLEILTWLVRRWSNATTELNMPCR